MSLNLDKPGVKALVDECRNLTAEANKLKPDVDDARRTLRNLEHRYDERRQAVVSLRHAIGLLLGYATENNRPPSFEQTLDEAVGKLR